MEKETLIIKPYINSGSSKDRAAVELILNGIKDSKKQLARDIRAGANIYFDFSTVEKQMEFPKNEKILDIAKKFTKENFLLSIIRANEQENSKKKDPKLLSRILRNGGFCEYARKLEAALH